MLGVGVCSCKGEDDYVVVDGGDDDDCELCADFLDSGYGWCGADGGLFCETDTYHFFNVVAAAAGDDGQYGG